MATTTRSPDKDKRFLARIEAALQTAQAWDGDPLLLAECRARIPPNLMDSDSPYSSDDDELFQHNPNLRFLKRLAVFFQKSMSWVNAPPCVGCGNKETKLQTVRGPVSQEEREGGAARVEVYNCSSCQDNSTIFPRYNSVRKLLDTCQGRCGEYANLFGLYCRAAGFETRYISDFTDHVWVEVYVGGTRDPWIMADGCEGLIDRASMYESGWGKKLNYTIAATHDSVTDVTPRYTRQWRSPEFQARRREICSSEQASQQMLDQVNRTLQQNMPKSRVEELERRVRFERRLFAEYQSTSEWTPDEKHGKGRISGSLEWKLSRQEAGSRALKGDESKEKKTSGMRALHVESFYPRETVVTISVEKDKGITVCGADCSIGGASISVAVIDELYLGCLLQARGFDSWKAVNTFMETLPRGRIVAVHGVWELQDNDDTVVMSRLGGFLAPGESEEILYIGQVEAHPDWTKFTTCSQSREIKVELPSSKPSTPLKLRTEKNICPRRVATRLPERIMPLATQLLANEEQKRMAYAKFVAESADNHSRKRRSGYTTQSKAPVYLLDSTAFPFERSKADWTTFHFLPEPLVPGNAGNMDDTGMLTNTAEDATPIFEIPVEATFFTQLLGPNVLKQVDGSTSPALIDTKSALSDARLVGLYFSAHWCGPCRRFTPVLAEMYSVLKERVPHQGLEIVFVSSDRELSGFQRYFATMPWLAVPLQSAQATIIPQIKSRYGVRGIPSLVILDVVSGQVVVSMSEARNEVMQAGQGGEDSIEEMLHSWLGRIPSESKELVEMMALSLTQDDGNSATSGEDLQSYLYRASAASPAKVDPATRIKELFGKLVSEGESPNAAAAKAIQIVTEEQTKKSTFGDESYGPGSLDGLALSENENENNSQEKSSSKVDAAIADVLDWNVDGKDAVISVLSTARKYVDNAMKDLSNPKFRSFRLSNKVADRITRIEGGLALICALGFYVYPADHDFMACIAVGADLDEMSNSLTRLLADNSSKE